MDNLIPRFDNTLMDEISVSLLKNYWFEELGCCENDLTPDQVLVVPHGTLKGYKGVLFFQYNETLIISAPDFLVQTLSIKTKDMSSQSCFRSESVMTILDNNLDRIIGPAWIGQIDSRLFQKHHSDETRLLTERDWTLLEELLNSCSTEESAHSSLEVGQSPTVGLFVNNRIVAAAGYKILEEKVAHIGVLVHPDYRGKGLASKVISGITELALKVNLGVQYRTLCSNKSSISAGKKVGFRDFAYTIAARIK